MFMLLFKIGEIEGNRLVETNRKGVVSQCDNARPHVSSAIRQKLLQLGCDVLVHPPFSVSLEPSDYHLFQKSLSVKSQELATLKMVVVENGRCKEFGIYK